EHRLALVPRPHFPVSDVDGVLRDLVVERLADDDWLPSATSGLLPGAGAGAGRRRAAPGGPAGRRGARMVAAPL
ncbi:hypothetical protein SZMC14600_22333, partial [Saccharomonospora azurea SZMC 14600]|uniref:hypothetical protein n=1 Tax=Saccharomonospora azurea TaxID=40988 RepID=UPI00023FFC0D